MFDVPFDEIAPIVGRTPAAARKAASRARHRVQGAAPAADADLARQRQVVSAFLTAAREGDFDALVAVLDPDVVLRVDTGAAAASRVVHGATAVAKLALVFGRKSAQFARLARVNGAPGVIAADQGRLLSVLGFTVFGGKIAEIDILTDPARLSQLDLIS
jgi:RNA polymerase sigma-70 factor (ECF subfamily)